MTDPSTALTPIEPGIYDGIPFREYLAIDAFHKSDVLPLEMSAAEWKFQQDHPKKTAALEFGSLIDTLIFEPDQFPDRFNLLPKTYVDGKDDDDNDIVKPWNGQTNICKQIKAQMESSDLPLISAKDYQIAMMMKSQVYNHRTAREYLSEGRPQVTLIWIDAEFGVLCKARTDWLRPDSIIDYKSTIDASEYGFPRQVDKYGYYIQASFYRDGYHAVTGDWLPFKIIAGEKAGPLNVATYRLDDPESLLTGRKQYKRNMLKLMNCKQYNHYPGYSDFEEPLALPSWSIRQELGDEDPIEGEDND